MNSYQVPILTPALSGWLEALPSHDIHEIQKPHLVLHLEYQPLNHPVGRGEGNHDRDNDFRPRE